MFRWRPLRGEDIELCRRRVARAKHAEWLAEVDLARFERRLAHGQLPGLTPAMAAHCRIILQRAVRTATERYDEAIEDLRRVRDDLQFRRAHHLRRAA